MRRITKIINLKFFDTMTEQLAYFMGFVSADGYVYKSTKKSALLISLAIKDKGFLFDLGDLVGFKGKYIYSKQTNSVRLALNSKQVVDFFVNNNITSPSYKRKNLPNLSKDMFRHFFRGYFDGDGYVRKSHAEVSIICGNKSIIYKLAALLPSDIKTTIREVKRVNICYVLIITGFKNLIRLKTYMYKDSSICLLRKKIVFENLKHKNWTSLSNNLWGYTRSWKHGEFPAWLTDGFAQAEKYNSDKIPLLIVKEKGKHEEIVFIKLDDFTNMINKGKINGKIPKGVLQWLPKN